MHLLRACCSIFHYLIHGCLRRVGCAQSKHVVWYPLKINFSTKRRLWHRIITLDLFCWQIVGFEVVLAQAFKDSTVFRLASPVIGGVTRRWIDVNQRFVYILDLVRFNLSYLKLVCSPACKFSKISAMWCYDQDILAFTAQLFGCRPFLFFSAPGGRIMSWLNYFSTGTATVACQGRQYK